MVICRARLPGVQSRGKRTGDPSATDQREGGGRLSHRRKKLLVEPIQQPGAGAVGAGHCELSGQRLSSL